MERCDSVLVAHDGFKAVRCELPAGHQLPNKQRSRDVRYSLKHHCGGSMWTTEGAARVAAEEAKAFTEAVA